MKFCDPFYSYGVLCACVLRDIVSGRKWATTTEYVGWEVLSPHCSCDGSSFVPSGLGTGVAVLVVGREQVRHEIAMGWERGGTGRTYFTVGWAVGRDANPVPFHSQWDSHPIGSHESP